MSPSRNKVEKCVVQEETFARSSTPAVGCQLLSGSHWEQHLLLEDSPHTQVISVELHSLCPSPEHKSALSGLMALNVLEP